MWWPGLGWAGGMAGGGAACFLRALHSQPKLGKRPTPARLPASYFISSKMRFGLMNESYMKGIAGRALL